MAKLRVIVPITIGLIFLLLYSTFDSLRQATLIILNLPFALIGGVVALWLTGEYLSVPASVGFINLFGVAVLNGIVLVSCMNALREEGARPGPEERVQRVHECDPSATSRRRRSRRQTVVSHRARTSAQRPPPSRIRFIAAGA